MPENKSHDFPGGDPNEFDPDKADIDPRLEERNRFSEVLTRSGYQDVLILARENVADLDDRHVLILNHLEDQSPPSVRALADDLEEDKGTISRALKSLAEVGAIELVDEGRSKRPVLAHEHIVIEPLV